MTTETPPRPIVAGYTDEVRRQLLVRLGTHLAAGVDFTALSPVQWRALDPLLELEDVRADVLRELGLSG